MTFRLPIKTRSELNSTEGWQKRYTRQKAQKRQLTYCIAPYRNRITLPCDIRFIRIAPRILDDDNLASAFKHLRDAIADLIIPGLAPGRADGDKRLSWSYDQLKGRPKEYAIEISLKSSEEKK